MIPSCRPGSMKGRSGLRQDSVNGHCRPARRHHPNNRENAPRIVSTTPRRGAGGMTWRRPPTHLRIDPRSHRLPTAEEVRGAGPVISGPRSGDRGLRACSDRRSRRVNGRLKLVPESPAGGSRGRARRWTRDRHRCGSGRRLRESALPSAEASASASASVSRSAEASASPWPVGFAVGFGVGFGEAAADPHRSAKRTVQTYRPVLSAVGTDADGVPGLTQDGRSMAGGVHPCIERPRGHLLG